MNKIDIRKLFEDKQEQMLKTFGLNKYLVHSGSKGDATEEEWVSWFNTYLPKKYKATANGYVIDCNGNLSEQIDIIIYDTHFSPLVFELGGQKYIAVESVYAVFEVKQDLTKEHIEYAAKKISSVRTLERTSAGIKQLDGRVIKKELYKILGGLLTLRTNWVKDNIESNIETNVKLLDSNNEIDFICCLQSYACEIIYDEKIPEFHGTKIYDLRDIKIKSNKNNGALIYTYIKLFKMLQNLGNCAAIEYDRYGIEE